MRFADVLIKNALKEGTSEETRPGILVPINSSASAFNSIEYALNIAKALNTTIHLVYVTDLDDLPESNNPLVISRMLNRFERKAALCVESLKEMIEESGVKVPTAESGIGNVESLIQSRIKFLTPGMIVIGRDSFGKQALNNLVDQATCPVVFVPEKAKAALPNSFVLALNDDRIPNSIYPLLKIIQQSTRQLTVLCAVRRKRNEFNSFQSQLFGANCDVSIKYLQHKGPMKATGLDNFVNANEVDLLCVVRGKRPLLRRIFTRDLSTRILHAVEIPVLVVK